MIFRLFSLVFLLAVAFLPSGCASTEDSADDQMNTFQSTPQKPDDDHGWGANLQGAGGQH
jgi:uncharacterized protein YceK